MMKILAIAVALTCFAGANFEAWALARNPGSNDSAIVVNKSTKDAAAHDAVLACGSNCEVLFTFQNACVAYAALSSRRQHPIR